MPFPAFWSSTRRTVLFWVGIASAIVTPIAVLGLGYRLYEFNRYQQFSAQASGYVEQFEHNLIAAIVLNRTLTAVFRANSESIDSPDVQSVLHASIDEFPYVRHLRMMPASGASATVSQVHTQPDDALFDQDAVFLLDSKRSVEMKESMIAGPLKLTDGQPGLVVQTPLFVPNSVEPSMRFWGFVQSVIPVQSLLESSGFNDLDTLHTHYAIWKTDENSGERIVLASDGEMSSFNTFDLPVALINHRWWITFENPRLGQTGWYWVAVSLISGSISSFLVFRLVRRRRFRKELKAATSTQNERMGRISTLLNLYQDIFDSIDSGLVIWNKNQVLESWNFVYEKMYPGIAKSMTKGMTRRELRALIEERGEVSATHDWESLGTWYRHLPDGRIIMLKRTAMPDGGRLVMHTDMTQSLGDDDE